jgi:hypothetical protein
VRRGEGSSNEGEGGKTYLFCTVLKELKEHESVMTPELLEDVVCIINNSA